MRIFPLARTAPICHDCAALLLLLTRQPGRERATTVRWYSDRAAVAEGSNGRVTIRRVAPSGRLDALDVKRPARTRFAPSPTGFLHLGSLRTALYNYLLARRTGGQFVLRVEDTDQNRLVSGAEDRLYQDLKWAGLSWDEGPDIGGRCGPYKQSERLAIYDKYVDTLLLEGKAYRCFCSPESLERLKHEAHSSGRQTHYPGTCRAVSAAESQERADRGEAFCVRFKSRTAPAAPATFYDLTYKRFASRQYSEDFIIRKRDGFPTYHLANVVDDKLMEITHVIRGAEWLISTPKHIELYEAFGWNPPVFAHVPLLVNEKREKLSKRHDGVALSWYQQRDILPSTLLNFSYLLGRGVKRGSGDTFTLEDMVAEFATQFTKGDVIVSMDKLRFLQRWHLKRHLTQDPPDMPLLLEHVVKPIDGLIAKYEAARIAGTTNSSNETSPVSEVAKTLGPTVLACRPDGPEASRHEYIMQVLRESNTDGGSYDTVVRVNRYLFWDVPRDALKECFSAVTTVLDGRDDGPDATPVATMKFLVDQVEQCRWAREDLAPLANRVPDGKGKPATFKLLRWALLASYNGPGIPQVMMLLGREETLRRMRNAVEAAEELAGKAGQPDGKDYVVGQGSGQKPWQLKEEASRLEEELLK